MISRNQEQCNLTVQQPLVHKKAECT